jgi:hypothetical protein
VALELGAGASGMATEAVDGRYQLTLRADAIRKQVEMILASPGFVHSDQALAAVAGAGDVRSIRLA